MYYGLNVTLLVIKAQHQLRITCERYIQTHRSRVHGAQHVEPGGLRLVHCESLAGDVDVVAQLADGCLQLQPLAFAYFECVLCRRQLSSQLCVVVCKLLDLPLSDGFVLELNLTFDLLELFDFIWLTAHRTSSVFRLQVVRPIEPCHRGQLALI